MRDIESDRGAIDLVGGPLRLWKYSLEQLLIDVGRRSRHRPRGRLHARKVDNLLSECLGQRFLHCLHLQLTLLLSLDTFLGQSMALSGSVIP